MVALANEKSLEKKLKARQLTLMSKIKKMLSLSSLAVLIVKR